MMSDVLTAVSIVVSLVAIYRDASTRKRLTIDEQRIQNDEDIVQKHLTQEHTL